MTYVDLAIIPAQGSMLSAPSVAVVVVSAASTTAGGEEVDLLNLAPVQAALLRQDHRLLLFLLLLLLLVLYFWHQVHGRDQKSSHSERAHGKEMDSPAIYDCEVGRVKVLA
jgi:hypothetical protein